MSRFSLWIGLLVIFAQNAAAQSAAPNYGQCGGIGWTESTACASGWTCIASSDYYSQCLTGSSSPTTTDPKGGSGASTPTPTTSAASGTATLQTGYSWIRSVEEPNFHKYLQSEVANTTSIAALGDPDTAGQFQVVNGQLIQNAGTTPLYAIVEGRANSTVMKLGMSWSTAPASGSNAGTFVFNGDSLEWSIPTTTRPQDNAWLVCPDANNNLLLYINLGPYAYETPAGCADETIHAYTGTTAVP
ncbi:carbohydrate-binding module family 1 protein [Serpula lacrymans var. lacrymans S7.3]|uniref:Carbohydrate-binding module family 1 protein n=2 Tax=Serpula lacrymans var. lacrymans TaxID=341189 RepID=F8PTM4_SERL3|nr:carbohydrate-binding module family 1 protein [Serpula lacrymans var. lacrymans S7.9]EGO01019.1 carbohydrate-binding module family 1 protein [Serpula lacrymans var. lacrymans S7.3]EGO26687.1 carbohydrate-binding module family 1 protein [Serpula lacrymans var. lacrymans S7.9]